MAENQDEQPTLGYERDTAQGNDNGWEINTEGYQITTVNGEKWEFVKKPSGHSPGTGEQIGSWLGDNVPGLDVFTSMAEWVQSKGDPVGGNSYAEIEGNERKIVKGESSNRIYGDQWDWLFGGEHKRILGMKDEMVFGAATEVLLGGEASLKLGLLVVELAYTLIRLDISRTELSIEMDGGHKLVRHNKQLKIVQEDMIIEDEIKVDCMKHETTAVTEYKMNVGTYSVECTSGAVNAATTLKLQGTTGAELKSPAKVDVLVAPAGGALALTTTEATLSAPTSVTLQGGTGAVKITAASTEIGSSMKIMHTVPFPPRVTGKMSDPLVRLQGQLARAGVLVQLAKAPP